MRLSTWLWLALVATVCMRWAVAVAAATADAAAAAAPDCVLTFAADSFRDSGIQTVKQSLYGALALAHAIVVEPPPSSTAAQTQTQALAATAAHGGQWQCRGRARIRALCPGAIRVVWPRVGLDRHTGWMTPSDTDAAATVATAAAPCDGRASGGATPCSTADTSGDARGVDVPLSHYFDVSRVTAALPRPLRDALVDGATDGSDAATAVVAAAASARDASRSDWVYGINGSCVDHAHVQPPSGGGGGGGGAVGRVLHARSWASMGVWSARPQFALNRVPTPLLGDEGPVPSSDADITAAAEASDAPRDLLRQLVLAFSPLRTASARVRDLIATANDALRRLLLSGSVAGAGNASVPAPAMPRYNAVYVRAEADWARVCDDFALHVNCYYSAARTAARLVELGVSRTVPLLVAGASTHRDALTVQPFRDAGFALVLTKQRLVPALLHDANDGRWGTNDVALLEHALCVGAHTFVGHALSSFSAAVRDERWAVATTQSGKGIKGGVVDGVNFVVNEAPPHTRNAAAWATCHGGAPSSHGPCAIERALYRDGCNNAQRQFRECWKQVMES